MTTGEALTGALPAYEVGTELGRGGFGVVVAGRHRQLAREVAIKQLAHGLVNDPKVRERFLAEGRTLAALDHPHIVPIYDYVESGETCVLVMEYLGGGTVWDRFLQRGYSQPTACAIVLVTCSALHFAHQRGVLHRDIKPENLMFNATGVLKVTDFGIAQVLGGEQTLATSKGDLLGTPSYTAPEQILGEELGPQADVYATGVMLYELLSGRLPFSEEGGAQAILERHCYAEPEPLLRVAPHVAPELAEVTMTALARPPRDRFSTTEEMGVALAEAAGAHWDAGWMERSDIGLRDSGPILASAERPSRRLSAGGQASGGAAAQPLGGGPSGEVVRPDLVLHAGGAAYDVSRADLVPVRQIVSARPMPKSFGIASLALLAVVLILALAGVGSPNPHPSLGAGAVSIDGVDPAAVQPVPVDLSKPIRVQVSPSAATAPLPGQAHLSIKLAGISAVSATGNLVPGPGGRTATLDASGGHYVVGGLATATLSLERPGAASVSEDTAVTLGQPPYATIVGGIAIAFILLVIADAEAVLRSLRRGRQKAWSGTAGLAVAGVGVGIAAVALAWLAGLQTPGIVTLIICAVLGLGSGLCAAPVAVAAGQRARARRAAGKLLLVAAPGQ